MKALVTALGTGTVLQIAMVTVGHASPALQEYGLFPIAGTLIGLATGVLAGGPRSTGGTATTATPTPQVAADAASATASPWLGALSAGLAGSLGSLVSTAFGDVPLSNVIVAGGSTVVMGAIGTAIRNRFSARVTSRAEAART